MTTPTPTEATSEATAEPVERPSSAFEVEFKQRLRYQTLGKTGRITFAPDGLLVQYDTASHRKTIPLIYFVTFGILALLGYVFGKFTGITIVLVIAVVVGLLMFWVIYQTYQTISRIIPYSTMQNIQLNGTTFSFQSPGFKPKGLVFQVQPEDQDRLHDEFEHYVPAPLAPEE